VKRQTLQLEVEDPDLQQLKDEGNHQDAKDDHHGILGGEPGSLLCWRPSSSRASPALTGR
jgi:hypothetical protein